MTRTAFAAALAAISFIGATNLAFAHAALTPKEAMNGASVKVAVTIPHGCDGLPTDTVIIKLPEGFVSAKPQVKAGWQIEVTRGEYANSYEVHREPVTSGALEIKWSGGAIPDDQVDEFVVQGSLQGFDAGAKLPFAITQICGDAAVAWDQVAAAGQDAHALEHPAPVLTVNPATAETHHHGAQPQAAPAVTLGSLALSGAFTRATLPAAKVGGGYVTITNTGADGDRLVAVTSPAAQKVELHEMKMEGDQMKMGPKEDGIEIPAGETVTLAPGGVHIMFMGLAAPFVEGETVPVTLTFEKTGTVEIELMVGAVAADHAGH
jgi:uncharacterized protein YcnI/copper(I)-binding protein